MSIEKKKLEDEQLEGVAGGTQEAAADKRKVMQYGVEDTLYDPSLILKPKTAAVKQDAEDIL